MTSRQEHDGVTSAAVDVPGGSVRAWFSLVAGAPAGGAVSHAHGAAIAAIGLGGDIDAAFSALSIRPVPVGGVALRSLAGVDTGLVARPTSGSAYLFPHAGPEVVRRLLQHCRDAGLVPMETLGEKGVSPTERWPEARDDHEARVLDALAGAPSPLAIDVLLSQLPERDGGDGVLDSDAVVDIRTSPLRHLLRPPIVAALGPPNIGKSTLLNALAGRSVALVADEPGTTRDHVGVTLDLAGLTVHWLDLPGIGVQAAASPISSLPSLPSAINELDAEAQMLALDTLRSADLVLLCTDPTTDPVAEACLLQHARHRVSPGAIVLRVLLRADLERSSTTEDSATAAADSAIGDGLVGLLRVSIRPSADDESAMEGGRSGDRGADRTVGLDRLVLTIREALVPGALVENPPRLRFWDGPNTEHSTDCTTPVHSPDRPA